MASPNAALESGVVVTASPSSPTSSSSRLAAAVSSSFRSGSLRDTFGLGLQKAPTMARQNSNLELLTGDMGDGAAGVRIGFQDITMHIRTKHVERTILDRCSGAITPGSLTAIMGPSGGGKTSLLTVLAGRCKGTRGLTLTGSISVDGAPVTDFAEYRSRIAFVEQDDLMFPTLTVRETIAMAAELRLPRDMPYADKMKRVDVAISELGLKQCADTYIGSARIRGVSGGERKRVAVAVEIIRGARVMFLDEPTSGLDSFQALRVMTTLAELCKRGRTVVASIHQPRSSIFAEFKDLILIQNGAIIYNGRADDALRQFEAAGFRMPAGFNSADFILDIISTDTRSEEAEAKSKERIAALRRSVAVAGDGKNLRAMMDAASASDLESPKSWTASPVHVVVPAQQQRGAAAGAGGMASRVIPCCSGPAAQQHEATFFKQLSLLTVRAWKQRVRDPPQMIVPAIIAVVFGTILGVTFVNIGTDLQQKNIQGLLGVCFYMVLNQLMQAMLNVAGTFPSERDIVNRERAANSYAVLPYYIAKVALDIPQLIYPFIFTVMVFFIARLSLDAGIFFTQAGIIMLTYFCATAAGMFIAAATPSQDAASAIGTPVVLIFALYSGFYANITLITPVLSWIQYISPLRWAYSATLLNVFTPYVFTCTDPRIGCIASGEALIERYGYQNDSIWRSCVVLLGLSAGFHTLGYFILRFKVPRWIGPVQAPAGAGA